MSDIFIPVVAQPEQLEAVQVPALHRDDQGTRDLIHRLYQSGEPFLNDYTTPGVPYLLFTLDRDTSTRLTDHRFVAYGQVVTPGVPVTLEQGEYLVFGEDTISIHAESQFGRRFRKS